MDLSELVLAGAEPFVNVARRSSEWGWLEYLLQASCQTSRIRLRSAHMVANRRLQAENEQRCRGMQQFHAWVPVAELPQSTSVQEVCHNGFRAGHAGVSFHIGNVTLPGMFRGVDETSKARDARGRDVRGRGRALPAGRRLYEFLLCRVGVGRSFKVEKGTSLDAVELPPEYDSFFINHQVIDDASTEGVLPRHILHHEYVVRDPAQALPVYLVHFEFDPAAQERLELPLCDLCGVRAALKYCEADDAVFCPACDHKVHSNSIAMKHKRVDVNLRPGAPKGSCPDHPEVEADKFCTVCQVPICPHCLSLGSHGAGEAASHRLVDVGEAYEDALHREQADKLGPRRQQAEESLLKRVDAKLSEVQEAAMATEDELYERARQANQKAQELAEEQAAFFRADQREAQRQLEQAAWLESFLEGPVKDLPPAQFLDTWLAHCGLRDELAEMNALGPPRASAALTVEGSLRLRAERPRRRRPQSQSPERVELDAPFL